MHTYEGESCTIHYNSDLSGECIMMKGDDDIWFSMKDVLDLLRSLVLDCGETRFLSLVVQDPTNPITAISIETREKDEYDVATTRVLTIRGE